MLARLTLVGAILMLVAGCAAPGPAAPNPQGTSTPGHRQSQGGKLKVVAAETFLTDIVRNVGGDRVSVDSLVPVGVDPHAFELTPADVVKVAGCELFVINGGGIEPFLRPLLAAVSPPLIAQASIGLASREPKPGEHPEGEVDPAHKDGDPHFWLDPTKVISYVEVIRGALTDMDEDGEQQFQDNAVAYTAKLNELDAWIKEQVAQIPESRRLLVTNHESFGYFADRYGFRIVGAIIPSVSTEASPSAQELARLAEQIKATGAPAIFLETGANAQLADQLARETGIKVVTGLLTHSVTAEDGPAPDYISMMKYNVNAIVDALK